MMSQTFQQFSKLYKRNIKREKILAPLAPGNN